jgi:hypothetical protein
VGAIGGANRDVIQEVHLVPKREKNNKLVDILSALGEFIYSPVLADFMCV